MEKFSYFKIGIFVISAVVIGIIGVVVLGVGTIFQKKNIVETYIDESVQGLDVGSPLKFRGVPVGRVEQISLTSAEYATRREYVVVRMSISSNMFQFPVNDPTSAQLKEALDRGFRIRIAPQGLPGVAYLEADYLDPERNPPIVLSLSRRDLHTLSEVGTPEAKNLEAISKAIDQHNMNCPFPAAEVRMNPFEIERLGWDEIRGLPLVPDPELGTGRFRIVCSRLISPVSAPLLNKYVFVVRRKRGETEPKKNSRSWTMGPPSDPPTSLL